MLDVDQLAAALRANWTEATSAVPELWTEDNPSRGQCDVTSLVVLEYLGGDLQLAEVSLNGEPVEHHYWNQLTGRGALDLTGEQFKDGQHIGRPETVAHDMIRSSYPAAREELRLRHQALREAVSRHLRAEPEHPLGGQDQDPPQPAW